MKKIQYYLAIIALAATLSVPALLGIGSGSLANAVASRHASSVSSSFALKRYPVCPGGGTYDC